MGVDTYLVIPSPRPARAKALLEDDPSTGDPIVCVCRDCVVVRTLDSFESVRAEPEAFGPSYAAAFSPWIKKGLDRRGLLAIPDVVEPEPEQSHADLEAGGLWLPVKAPRARRREKRVLLVPLSQAQLEAVFKSPALARDLVANRERSPVPGAVEFGAEWIPLQKLLFDCMWETGVDDPRADAIAPRHGLSFYEDKRIDSSRLIRPEPARACAEWILGLTDADVARVSQRGVRSPASECFPNSLGASEADDLEPVRVGRLGPPKTVTRELRLLQGDLARAQAFYRGVLDSTAAVLAIRFRG